jgi:hypothetical protein
MVAIINALISKLGVALQALLLLLPQSPFTYILSVDNKFIQNINYILPLPQAVTHLTAMVNAVIIYYAIRIVLKWIKAAGN